MCDNVYKKFDNPISRKKRNDLIILNQSDNIGGEKNGKNSK